MAFRTNFDRFRRTADEESLYLVLGDIAQNLQRAAALFGGIAPQYRRLELDAARLLECLELTEGILELVLVERERFISGGRE